MTEDDETITLNLPNDEFVKIAMAAHQMDVTLNEFVNGAIASFIRETDLRVADAIEDMLADESDIEWTDEERSNLTYAISTLRNRTILDGTAAD